MSWWYTWARGRHSQAACDNIISKMLDSFLKYHIVVIRYYWVKKRKYIELTLTTFSMVTLGALTLILLRQYDTSAVVCTGHEGAWI